MSRKKKTNRPKFEVDGKIIVPYPVSWARTNAILPTEPGTASTLLALCAYADKYGVCWPSQRNLARLTGRGERTIARHLAYLEEHGWVARQQRYRFDGGNSSSLYTLTAYRHYVKGFLLSKAAPKQASDYDTPGEVFFGNALAHRPVEAATDQPAEETAFYDYDDPNEKVAAASVPKQPVEAPPAPTQPATQPPTNQQPVRAVTYADRERENKARERLHNLTGEDDKYVSGQDLFYELKTHPETNKALRSMRQHLTNLYGTPSKVEWKKWMATSLDAIKKHGDKQVAGWIDGCTAGSVKHPLKYFEQILRTAPPTPRENPNDAARTLLRNDRFRPGLPVRLLKDNSVWEVDIALSTGLISIERVADAHFIQVRPEELELINA